MKHKDEIWVCQKCKTANLSNNDADECIECYDLPSQTIRIHYLPSSSVKELVEAAKAALYYVRVSGWDHQEEKDLCKKLETALKQFEEEK